MRLHSVIDAAPVGGEVVVVTAPAAGGRSVIAVRDGAELELATSPLAATAGVERLIVGPQSWWYSRLVRIDRHARIVFVTAGGASTVTSSSGAPFLWLPIHGDEPSGLLFSPTAEGARLQVDELTPTAAKTLGTFAWNTSGTFEPPSARRWSAERLADGRTALVSAERSGGSDQVVKLRVFGADRVVEEATLPCPYDLIELTTAVDRRGTLGVIALSAKGEVVAMRVDVDRPTLTACGAISTAATAGEKVAIASTADGLAAAWLDRDGVVRAFELTTLRDTPPIVEIATGASTTPPLLRLQRGDDEQLTLVWRDGGGAFMTAQIPASVSGYSFAMAVERLICGPRKLARADTAQ